LLIFLQVIIAKIKKVFVKKNSHTTSRFGTGMDNWCTFTVVINSEGELRTGTWCMKAIPGM